jgi:thiamine transporter ThiT
VTFLYVIPIILVALEYGPVAGVAAGLAAVGLYAIWDATTDNHVTFVAYLTRTVSFVVVGWLTGRMADRLRAAGEQTATAAATSSSRATSCAPRTWTATSSSSTARGRRRWAGRART